MTKNMTRKSLALGAAAALVVTGFSAMPANAAGLADTSFVSLAPTTGTSYTTLAGSDYTFSLTANEASTVTGGVFKFLVSDPSDVIEVGAVPADEAANYRTVAVANDATLTATNGASGTVNVDTVTIDNAVLASGLAEGDKFYFTADLASEVSAGSEGFVIAADDTIFEVTDITNNVVSFITNVDISAVTAVGGVDAIDSNKVDGR